MRLLCTGDLHFSKIPPVSRDENYPRDILNKFKECILLAKKLHVDYLVSTGDFFHRKSAATFEEAKILMKLFKNSPVPVVGIGGNHDYTGYNIETMRYRPIGNLVESEHLLLLDHQTFDKFDTKLTGTSYSADYDTKRNAYFKNNALVGDYTVAITHGSLVLSEKGTFWGNYTNMNHLKKDKRVLHNIIFNGHMHHYQKSFKIDSDHMVFSIGSLARNVLKEDIAKRKPKVLYLKIKDGDFKAEEIELKNARPSDEVFKVTDYVDNEERDSIKEFVETLSKESGMLSIANDRDLVKKVIKKFGYSEKVEIKVLDYLENSDEY